MALKPIVVGVDGSPEATQAARIAWYLASATGAPCRLIHAVPDAWVALVAAQAPTLPDLPERLMADSRAAVTASLHGSVPDTAIAELEAVIGRAPVVLAHAAKDAGLMVVGARPHGALARTLGGSTAHYLVRTVKSPVLVAGPRGPPIRRVLAAVDLSFAAKPTLDVAREFARLTNARLRLLHVVEPVRPILAPHVDPEQVDRDAVKEFARETEAVTEVEMRDRVVRRGPAADVIAAEAAEWEADVVVVGSHGKGWVERVLLGSATERLLALQPASLLVVPVRPARSTTVAGATHPRGARRGTLIL